VYFPPPDSQEPKVFLDNVRIRDICYEPTPTPTPTCIQKIVFSDDFESGQFGRWEGAGPDWGVQVLHVPGYPFEGEYCAYFAGCEEEVGYGHNEAGLFTILNLTGCIAPVLEYNIWVDIHFDPDLDTDRGLCPENIFTVTVSGEGDLVTRNYDKWDTTHFYVHEYIPLSEFAGMDRVVVRFHSQFPITTHDPPPDSVEPKVFLDAVNVRDWCDETTPVPTPTQNPPLITPSTSVSGIFIMLALLSGLIASTVIRRTCR
jgi:hypothetical protein